MRIGQQMISLKKLHAIGYNKWLVIIGILLLTTSSAYASNSFILESKSIANNSVIAKLYTCEGKNISPELHWMGAPANTQTFALILSDPDAPSGTFYHWVLYNLPNTVTHLPENAALSRGAFAGENSWGNKKYEGPCPPKGASHHYIFTLYALDSTLNLSGNVDTKILLSALHSHVIDAAQLTAVFSR